MRRILLVAALALGLQGCALLGPMMNGIFGDATTVQDIQQSRSAREVHLAVAGMFEAIANELTHMLKDGTLTLAQGQRIEPMVKVGRTAIKASNAFLLQAGQERELGRDDVADNLDERGLAGFLGDCADRGLFLAPGPSFGPYPTHVRICFTSAPPEVVRRGVEVLASLLNRKAP